jgi:hypothetical protein
MKHNASGFWSMKGEGDVIDKNMNGNRFPLAGGKSARPVRRGSGANQCAVPTSIRSNFPRRNNSHAALTTEVVGDVGVF